VFRHTPRANLEVKRKKTPNHDKEERLGEVPATAEQMLMI
jgi:hypothetical protein